MTTETIHNAKIQNWKIFEQNKINMSSFSSKRYGSSVLYTEKKANEIIVFMPEIALAYNKVTERKNLLIVYDETKEYITFVFIDVSSLLNEDSLLKVKIMKDKYVDSNIMKIQEFALYYGVKNRIFDVICNKENCKQLEKIAPFNESEVKKNMNIISDSDTKKIIKNINPFQDKALSFKKTLIAILTIFLPFLLINSVSTNVIEAKQEVIKKSRLELKNNLQSKRKIQEELEKNNYIINSAHFQNLKNKKVLR